jgi:molybdate transport system ATP-binding protein
MGLDARLRKKLKHFTLDVSLSCKEGRLLAIVGPSGAGKTTIIRLIAGLEKADAGLVSCRGAVWTDTAARIEVPTRKRGIGYVFQEFTLFPNMSVYRNVAFAARDGKIVEDLLKMFDIWSLKDSRPHQISGGERQRCAICQALARDPRVLLMDEPFSALDALSRRKLRDMMRSLKSGLHIPVIHVTHDIREALYLADDIMPVVSGRQESKWILQFMLAGKEAGRNICHEPRPAGADDEEEDIELFIKTKEYLR